ncbi:DNA-3-methyladenine glycosylase I [Desulfotalea psychrophila]|uniref:Probable DNA-3-methyladenine glycosylase I n=1 Tax=Desulfotalea psychrophila (strain LSv54 / DSM 12343) TaxID=177439 RepID=Q6ARY2_DESPS|nr:DNA-3-methyladenine glycosylase I [Desulfotalea psychrophila]CAG34893.1 probable DNA-3-methyladenine glycosylase I [Desulfotalea psychrophila LSv54]
MKQPNNKEISRCAWCQGNELYQEYHDREWGVPCTDDKKLFEFIILESAQAGLNWLTILKRREAYRQAFADFKPEMVARFTEERVDEIILAGKVVRHRGKINSAINNAQVFLKIQEREGSFANYLWRLVDYQPSPNSYRDPGKIPTTTETSIKLSRSLKAEGMTFFGPTIAYAYMQAMGLVNDHLISCFRHQQCAEYGHKSLRRQ